MVSAEISASTLQLLVIGGNLLVLIVGAIIAYLVKKGQLDVSTVENTKSIANAMAGAIDTLKGVDPGAAKTLLQDVVTNVGDKKPVLDAFLKVMNLNKPANEETDKKPD